MHLFNLKVQNQEEVWEGLEYDHKFMNKLYKFKHDLSSCILLKQILLQIGNHFFLVEGTCALLKRNENKPIVFPAGRFSLGLTSSPSGQVTIRFEGNLK